MVEAATPRGRVIDRLAPTWGVNFSPQEAPEDLLALVEVDCQQQSSGDYNLDKAPAIARYHSRSA